MDLPNCSFSTCVRPFPTWARLLCFQTRIGCCRNWSPQKPSSLWNPSSTNISHFPNWGSRPGFYQKSPETCEGSWMCCYWCWVAARRTGWRFPLCPSVFRWRPALHKFWSMSGSMSGLWERCQSGRMCCLRQPIRMLWNYRRFRSFWRNHLLWLNKNLNNLNIR